MRSSEFVFKIAVPLLLFRTIAAADFHGAFAVPALDRLFLRRCA